MNCELVSCHKISRDIYHLSNFGNGLTITMDGTLGIELTAQKRTKIFNDKTSINDGFYLFQLIGRELIIL